MKDSILIATSNPGKLRDFAGAAEALGVRVAALLNFAEIPLVEEDGETFAANARKKAEAYSRQAPGHLVLADDSGLAVDALNGAPGVHSARYAAGDPSDATSDNAAAGQSADAANNAKLLRQLAVRPGASRAAKFVCVIAAARDGQTLATFDGEARGEILDAPRGTHGFGYDPLFYFPALGKTFAELSAAEKSKYSHRGTAFRKFLDWIKTQES